MKVSLPENDNWFWYRAAEGESYVFCGPAPKPGAEPISVIVPVCELPNEFLRQLQKLTVSNNEAEKFSDLAAIHQASWNPYQG
jgi:hypothetical protein